MYNNVTHKQTNKTKKEREGGGEIIKSGKGSPADLVFKLVLVK